MNYLHETLEFEKQLPAQIVIHCPENYYEVPEHWHRSLEINYIMSPVTTSINGNVRQLDDGDIMLANSGDIHRVTANDMTNIKAVTVMISYELLSTLMPDYDNYRFNMEKNPERHEDLAEVLRAIYCAYSGEGDIYRYLKINELLYRLLYLIFACCREERTVVGQISTTKHFERIKLIMEYIDENYRQPLKQEELAEHFAISKEHLSRSFKKYTGTTCMEYLEHVRLKYAYLQMMEQDLSMLEIALDNGFPDLRSFTQTFRRTYGTTPFKYKKKYTSKD